MRSKPQYTDTLFAHMPVFSGRTTEDAPPVDEFLLLESGDFIELESSDGDDFLLKE